MREEDRLDARKAARDWAALGDSLRVGSATRDLPASDRDDVVQEVLLRLWRLHREGDWPMAPGRFIRTVVRRLVTDRWRSRSRSRGPSPDEPEDPGRTPADSTALHELRGRLHRAIEALPEPQSRVVRMRLLEGRTYRSIAVAEGVPLNTALGRMHLAVRKLRRTLEEYRELT